MSAAGTSSEEVAPGDCEQEIIGAQWSTEARQACPERGSGDLQPSAEREDLCAHLRRRLPLTHTNCALPRGPLNVPETANNARAKAKLGADGTMTSGSAVARRQPTISRSGVALPIG